MRDARVVKTLIETFESDWSSTNARTALATPEETNTPEAEPTVAPDQAAVPVKEVQQVAQILAKELNPIADTVKKAVRVAVAKVGDDVLGDKTVKDTMKKVVKKAVKNAVKRAVLDLQVGDA